MMWSNVWIKSFVARKFRLQESIYDEVSPRFSFWQ